MKKELVKIFSGCLLLLASLAGCKENDDLMMYKNDPAVYFFAGTNVQSVDTLAYNFILLPIDQTRDTLYLPVRIMGDTANRDRVIEVVVEDSSTAKVGVDFEIGNKIVHAGRYADSVQVYVKRNAAQTTSILKLYLRIAPSKDFRPGYDDRRDFKVTITDQLVPPTWNFTMNSTFGAFSMVKFRFMVSTLQRVSFTGLLPSELAAMGSKCKVALSQYETANGPLLDENGLRVVFP